jgi:plastocyanin
MPKIRSSEDVMSRIALIVVAVTGSILLTGCGGSSAAPAAPAAPTMGTDGASAASLVIQHATAGCHDWSLNGSPMSSHQVARLEHGNGITITDNDVMPHQLIQLSGPAAEMANVHMNTSGAESTVVFPTPGVYKFTTKAGEDYPSASGLVTTGEDHVLTLTVYVS